MLATIEGPMGSGKTATATMIALQDYQENRAIFSNYHLNFPHTSFSQEMFFKLNEDDFQLNNCTILADEGYLYMDARTSMSTGNRALHYYAMQTRKRDVDMYITTQSYKKIDQRIREAVTTRIRCKFLGRLYANTDGDVYTGKSDEEMAADYVYNEELEEWELQPIVLRHATIRLLIRRLDQGGRPVRINYNVEKIFPLYDTNEVVAIPDKLVRLGQS